MARGEVCGKEKGSLGEAGGTFGAGCGASESTLAYGSEAQHGGKEGSMAKRVNSLARSTLLRSSREAHIPPKIMDEDFRYVFKHLHESEPVLVSKACFRNPSVKGKSI